MYTAITTDHTSSTTTTLNLTRNTVRFQHFKDLGNLAAIDCFATIQSTNTYQKTYQDSLKVDQLVGDGDLFFDDRPLNIDRLFKTQENQEAPIPNKGGFNGFENFKPKKEKGNNPNEDSIFMVSPDYKHE